MGLHQFQPPPSARMGIFWTLAPIGEAALVEFGCMGHLRYGTLLLSQAGISDGCKLYSTHIDEADIALGTTDRLVQTISDVIKRDQAQVIFLQPSSIPQVIGTDLSAIAEELQVQFEGIRLLPFACNGFSDSQQQGVEAALLKLVETLPDKTETRDSTTFNIIGSCADIFRFQSDAYEIARIMSGAFGLKPCCILSSNCTVSKIRRMGEAHINLVLRREGEAAAKHLQQQFGTPYVLGRPYGIDGTAQWLKTIEQISDRSANRTFIDSEQDKASSSIKKVSGILQKFRSKKTLSLGGHADVVQGILSFAVNELQMRKGTCWCDCPAMEDNDLPFFSESEWMKAIKSSQNGIIMASGEALNWAGYNLQCQIANPGTKRLAKPLAESPFVGFRGASHLAGLWMNTGRG